MSYRLPPGAGKSTSTYVSFRSEWERSPPQRKEPVSSATTRVLVYSHYAFAHVQAALSAFQLPKIDVKVLESSRTNDNL